MPRATDKVKELDGKQVADKVSHAIRKTPNYDDTDAVTGLASIRKEPSEASTDEAERHVNA